MTDYTTLLHPSTLELASNYLASIQSGANAGQYLNRVLPSNALSVLSLSDFIGLLVQTKHPQIFAESSVSGDGSDWNHTELSILGDISIAIPVTVYDNGLHSNPVIHEHPFPGTLLFTPGALLRNGRGVTPADWEELVVNNDIDPDGFYSLYERRLLPPLIYASQLATSRGHKAFVTVPGLGCGQFAGVFQGQLGEHLKSGLAKLIDNHKSHLEGIRAVYFDPYGECDNERLEFGNISYLVRPLTKGNNDRPQLCHPTHYEEPGDDFSDCELFSVVAWDHVSWPGNDFFIGSRATDDGVKAAATNSMELLTGIAGSYDKTICEYFPPSKYRTWGEVVDLNGLQLEVKDNIRVLPLD